jgi:hypothetical protein
MVAINLWDIIYISHKKNEKVNAIIIQPAFEDCMYFCFRM